MVGAKPGRPSSRPAEADIINRLVSAAMLAPPSCQKGTRPIRPDPLTLLLCDRLPLFRRDLEQSAVGRILQRPDGAIGRDFHIADPVAHAPALGRLGGRAV